MINYLFVHIEKNFYFIGKEKRYPMEYYHIDVFSRKPLCGNGLSVMICSTFPDDSVMQNIAKEMKQFETIFICARNASEYDARIFAIDEELFFAGHPILGAAAAVHEKYPNQKNKKILFHLKERNVLVDTDMVINGKEYLCLMDQGKAEIIGKVETESIHYLLEPLHISISDLSDNLPLEVSSTGLPYLIVPIKNGIEKAGIFSDKYEERLHKYGAKFVYVIDTANLEGRTWNNSGAEDVATGSAAGPVGDYLIRHGICSCSDEIILNQGRFLGRPSQIHIKSNSKDHMLVSGRVRILGKGIFYDL